MSAPTAKALVGSATRYIAGRNAVQTVYWHSKPDTAAVEGKKFVKVSKTLHFKKDSVPPAHIQHRAASTVSYL